MSTVDAFHTDTPEYPPTHRNVYHDQSGCPYGKEIKKQHREEGTGRKKRCSKCADLS